MLYYSKKNGTTELGNLISDLLVKTNGQVKKDKQGRMLVKESEVKKFITIVHEWCVHPGISTLYQNIKNTYYVKNLKNNIIGVLTRCEKCLRNKRKKRYKGLGYGINSNKKFHVICSDIFGPFEVAGDDKSSHYETTKGYFLTITDIYSRYTRIEFLQKITGKDLVQTFTNWIDENEKPKSIICDNGKQYTSKIFNSFLNKLGINKVCTPIYHPASNGISERLNQMIAEVLRMYKGEDIKRITELAMKRLNYNYHRAIQEHPISILQGYSEYDYIKNHTSFTPKHKNNKMRKLKKNKTKNIQSNIIIGDYVLIRNFVRNKLDDLFIGPFKITHISEKKLWLKVDAYNEWIHFDDIKLYKTYQSFEERGQDVVNTTF